MKFLRQNYRYMLGLIIIILLIIRARNLLYDVEWSGIGNYTSPLGEFEREKTLWDLLELIVVPLFLLGIGIAINQSIKSSEKLQTDNETQEKALQDYFDRMSDLLIKENLGLEANPQVRTIAKARTINILRALDSRRNQLVCNFLQEANLFDNPLE